MYGAQYGNNVAPDEARQRARPMTGFEDLGREQGAQKEFGSPCPGLWQWPCDNMQCIAQYDLCDGVEQCMDGSDEKNCKGRYPPQYPTNPRLPSTGSSTSKPSTTTIPKSESGIHPLKLIFAGAGAFIIVVGVAHFLMKKRQQLRGAVRNYRKGQSLVDDEDDLLINQMYS
ncbi:hypothetical protein FO519_006458 [Halicephalobus sp. NKZ332]|nr:hypothetical protein FO519_006458 [Halicephalobus sp. NKZ332]